MMAVGDSSTGHKIVAVQGNLGQVGLQTRWLPPATVVVLGLVLALPTLILGFPVGLHSDDGLIHLIWESHFSRQFWNGEFYPRWLMDMNGGRGSPSHFFYAPLPHLLTALLAPVFVDDDYAQRRLGVAAAVALIASGLSCYAWLRHRFRPGAGILGSFVYMAMPYHLADDLYARSSFNEFWSFVWLPLILLFTEKAARWPVRIAGISISYALLVLTHPLITFIFSPVVALYAGYLSLRRREHWPFIHALLGMGLGTMLAAIYLLPAMTGQDNVRMYEFMVRQGDWHVETGLLFAGMPWKLSLLVLNCALIATFGYLVSRRTAGVNRTWVWFWAAIFGAAFIMMTPASLPIWQVITPLKWLQFAWRFLVIATLACSAIVAAAAAMFPNLGRTMRLATMAFAVVVGLTWIPSYWYSLAKAYGGGQESLAEVMRTAGDPREYIPRWVHTAEFAVLGDGRTLFSAATADKLRVRSGEPRIEVRHWAPRDIEIAVSAGQFSTVEIGQFYYPNWAARVAGAPRLPITPSEPEGLITLGLPPGEYVVDVVLEKDWAESLGLLFSASAAAVVTFLFVLSLRKPASDRRRTSIGRSAAPRRGILS